MEQSYRQSFGLPNPPKGTDLILKFSEGINWYLYWKDCPDDENIVAGWFKSASAARKYADENGWKIKYQSQ